MTIIKKYIRYASFCMSLVLLSLLLNSCTKDGDTNKTKVTTVAEVSSTTSTTKKLETTTTAKPTEASKSESSSGDASNDELSSKIMDFIDPIYFNIIFGSNSYDEGITEDDMRLFAISYIYQYNYDGLKFDTDKFILYVPAKMVEEVVKQYFDVDIKEHTSFEEDGIMFERGFYLMPAADMNWSEKLIIEDIQELDDGSMEVKIMFDSPDGALPKKMLTIKKLDDRFILLGYKNVL